MITPAKLIVTINQHEAGCWLCDGETAYPYAVHGCALYCPSIKATEDFDNDTIISMAKVIQYRHEIWRRENSYSMGCCHCNSYEQKHEEGCAFGVSFNVPDDERL